MKRDYLVLTFCNCFGGLLGLLISRRRVDRSKPIDCGNDPFSACREIKQLFASAHPPACYLPDFLRKLLAHPLL